MSRAVGLTVPGRSESVRPSSPGFSGLRAFGLHLLLLAGCSSTVEPPPVEPPIPTTPIARWERVFAAALPGSPDRALVGGFDGALEPGRAVRIRSADTGALLAEAHGDADGRFRIEIAARAGDRLNVETASTSDPPVVFRVRDPAAARAEAVRAPLEGMGSVPNDLVIAGSSSAPRAVVVRSGDNAVSVIDLDRGLVEGGCSIRLPEVEERPRVKRRAAPWFVTPIDAAGDRVAVTASGQRHVYVLDLARCAIERTLALGAAQAVVVDPPIALPFSFDVDGDGALEQSVSRFVPETPQGLAVAGGRLVVGFASFLIQSIDGKPPIFLPGVAAIWQLDQLDRAPAMIELPAFNPQELRATADGRVLVVCTGTLDLRGGTPTALTPGAALLLDPATGAIVESWDLGDFAPATALIAAGSLWAGSLSRAKVLRVDLAGGGAAREEIVLNEESVDSIFRLIELPGGLVAVPSFDTDRLHLIDPRRRELDPAPFFGPIVTGPGRPLFDGLQILAVRPGRAGVDFVGPDLFALEAASAVTPIELRKVLGP